MNTRVKIIVAGASLTLMTLMTWAHSSFNPSHGTATSVIVQGNDMLKVEAVVESVGGEITHELGIIDAVGAHLTVQQQAQVLESPHVTRIVEDRLATTAGSKKKKLSSTTDLATIEATSTETLALQSTADYDYAPALIAANRVHASGITGAGITVAFLDTGVFTRKELELNEARNNRIVAQYDAITGQEIRASSDSDQNGHGTHMAAIATSNGRNSKTVHYKGMAPNVNVVIVKAFGEKGEGSYANVIRGIDWVVKNKERFGIRVLNLSFSAPAQSHYWDDPVNQAVMRAWQEGIFVVASAGNTGPSPMTIGVPGNVPYVLTVGAMTNSYTPDDKSDDRLTTFSAAGPTSERFVKPDVLAPGGHVTALMPGISYLAVEHPEFADRSRYFTMSGTSQAAAVASGLAALVLENDPLLTPDELKCRLMAGAHPAVTAEGNLGYSVFQQGAGLVNAYDAVFNTASGCANIGLDVDMDLSGEAHFAGAARIDEDGNFYIEGFEHSLATGSFLWNNSMLWNSSFLWNNSMLWNSSFLWNSSMLWNSSFLWNNSELFNDSFLWNSSMLWNNSELSSDSFLWNSSLAVPMNINTWVKPE